MDFQTKLNSIMTSVPYEKIREDSFNALKVDGLLTGRPEDIEYIIMEQVDIFKLQYGKKFRDALWDAAFHQIRKTLAHDVKKWHADKVATGMAETMAKELCAAMTEDMDNFDLTSHDIGEAGA